jgi:hypothetical protein
MNKLPVMMNLAGQVRVIFVGRLENNLEDVREVLKT